MSSWHYWKRRESKLVVTRKKIIKFIDKLIYGNAEIGDANLNYPTEEAVFVGYQWISHMKPKHYHKCRAYITEQLPIRKMEYLLTRGN